jgi:hypothetical protein
MDLWIHIWSRIIPVLKSLIDKPKRVKGDRDKVIRVRAQTNIKFLIKWGEISILFKCKGENRVGMTEVPNRWTDKGAPLHAPPKRLHKEWMDGRRAVPIRSHLCIDAAVTHEKWSGNKRRHTEGIAFRRIQSQPLARRLNPRPGGRAYKRGPPPPPLRRHHLRPPPRSSHLPLSLRCCDTHAEKRD